ncbi:MAG: hypothetical protein J6104_04960 [Methanomicrobium sp.]|nr:hypothetical protein [Methanomicrobium sp.]
MTFKLFHLLGKRRNDISSLTADALRDGLQSLRNRVVILLRILGKTALVGNGLPERRRKLGQRPLDNGFHACVELGIGVHL